MGALHAGHLALVARAAADGAPVLVSIFVNPTQFNRPEDLASYPRDEDGDIALLRNSEAAAVWFPSAVDLYPDGVQSQHFDLKGSTPGSRERFGPVIFRELPPSWTACSH